MAISLHDGRGGRQRRTGAAAFGISEGKNVCVRMQETQVLEGEELEEQRAGRLGIVEGSRVVRAVVLIEGSGLKKDPEVQVCSM